MSVLSRGVGAKTLIFCCDDGSSGRTILDGECAGSTLNHCSVLTATLTDDPFMGEGIWNAVRGTVVRHKRSSAREEPAVEEEFSSRGTRGALQEGTAVSVFITTHTAISVTPHRDVSSLGGWVAGDECVAISESIPSGTAAAYSGEGRHEAIAGAHVADDVLDAHSLGRGTVDHAGSCRGLNAALSGECCD